MASDTLDLADFYESRSGEVARHLIRRQIRALWPSVRGDAILGLGYSMPYLRQFRNEAERLLAVVPPGQGMLPQWPAPVACATCLAAEEALPFPNDAFDRILLVHCLEHSRQLDDLLREVWRTLKGEGLLLVVAPNRRGLWARLDRTPFGQGRPYSHSQLSRLLREYRFMPLAARDALFMPPSERPWLLRTAPAWDRIGARWLAQFGGVNLLLARKRVQALQPSRPVRQSRRPRLVLPAPVGARPYPSRRSNLQEGKGRQRRESILQSSRFS